MCSLRRLLVRECAVRGGMSVRLIGLLVHSARQPILETYELPWLVCVCEALPASSVCFRNEVLSRHNCECTNQSSARLHQNRLKLQNVKYH